MQNDKGIKRNVNRLKQRSKYTKKRRKVFCGAKTGENRNADIERPVPVVEDGETINESLCSNSSIASKKIEGISPRKQKNISGFRFVDMEILAEVISTLPCPSCSSPVLLSERCNKKQGFASMLEITCSTCNYINPFYTSKVHTAKRYYEINHRMVYAMRACGQGHGGMETFTSLMNMPKPMTQKNYDKMAVRVKDAVKKVAEATMSDAALELKEKHNATPTDVIDIPASLDGSWQRRGFASLNGNVAAISMEIGKVIDTEAISKTCKPCKKREHTKDVDPAAYEAWKANHKCLVNYQGSASGMEVAGAKRIFERSIAKNGLRITEYYGDGDSKSFASVKGTYEGITVKKMECVGHVQKRVGCRLRNLKKRNKGFGGRGKLTNATIDRLQNYYGIALRQNVNDLAKMKTAIHATLFHVSSSKTNNWHTHCPEGADSWCRFKQDKATGKSTYKPGPGLPLNVLKELKGIYNDLSSDVLLEKCLHGKTQNHNESLNGMIWNRIPKTRYCSHTQLEFGVYDAIANFNIGHKSSVLVYEELGFCPGSYSLKGCHNQNKKRLYHSNYKSSTPVKKRRKILRARRKGREDKNSEQEGKVYGAGNF